MKRFHIFVSVYLTSPFISIGSAPRQGTGDLFIRIAAIHYLVRARKFEKGIQSGI